MTQPYPTDKVPSSDRLRVGSVTLLVDQYKLRIDSRAVTLTRVEYRILLLLLRNAGVEVSLNQLAQVESDPMNPPSDRALRARIASVRRRLVGSNLSIQNLRGIGYRIIVLQP